jgi:GNAT superfamily N-acetyltransferase
MLSILKDWASDASRAVRFPLIEPEVTAPEGYFGPFVFQEISKSDILPLAIAAACEIEDEFPGNEANSAYIPLGHEHGICIKTPSGEIVALLVWDIYTADHVWIYTAWVHPEHRAKGLYKTLFAQLKAEAAKVNRTQVSCGVAYDNLLSKVVHEALGMKPIMVMYSGVL